MRSTLLAVLLCAAPATAFAAKISADGSKVLYSTYLPAGRDVAALASFCTTVIDGLAIQARDGASRKTLHFGADCALAAWDSLAATPSPSCARP